MIPNQGRREGAGSYCLMGSEFLLGVMKMLEIESSDGYSTGLYLHPLNCILMNGENDKFLMYLTTTQINMEDYTEIKKALHLKINL